MLSEARRELLIDACEGSRRSGSLSAYESRCETRWI